MRERERERGRERGKERAGADQIERKRGRESQFRANQRCNNIGRSILLVATVLVQLHL